MPDAMSGLKRDSGYADFALLWGREKDDKKADSSATRRAVGFLV